MHREVRIASDAELEAHVAPILPKLALPETEDSWSKIDSALVEFQTITKAGGARLTSYIAVVRDVAPCITRSLLSERTKLSGTASDVLNSMAPRLGDRFAVLLPIFMPPLLQLCARTNKVALKRAEKSIHLICRYCQLSGTIPYLVHALHEKAPGLRVVALGALIVLVDAGGSERLQKRVGEIEQVIHDHARDANSEVRALCRTLYAHYTANWPERQCAFATGLSPTSQRYLSSQTTSRTVPQGSTTLRSSSREAPTRSNGSASRMVANGSGQTALREPLRTTPKQPVRVVTRVHRQNPPPGAGAATSTDSERTIAASEKDASVSPCMPSSSEAVECAREPSPAASTLPPPPPRFSAPSEGVAYRLALAQEQARARSVHGSEARTRSRALLPSSTYGGARRVQVAKPESSISQSLGAKASLVNTKSSRTVSQVPRAECPINAPLSPKDDLKPSTPNKSPMRSQFTPQRRPFGVVNDARTQSPHVGDVVQ